MRRFLVAVAVLLGASACGGAENEPNLAKAVERTESTGSSRIEVRATLKEGSSQFPLKCEGLADYERSRVRFNCDLETFDLIAIGDTAYFKSDGFGISNDKRWLKVRLDGTDSIGNFSPEKLLTMLRDASLETSRVGEESVRQVPTVRYRLTVNCEEAQIGCQGTTAPVDVWIDDEGLVRRIELEDDGSPATIEFFDFGVEVEIEAPPADQVVGLDWTGSGPSQDPNAAPCLEREAAPISESRALDVLQSRGLSLRKDESGYCVLGIAAFLENSPEDFDREGYVSCHLYAEPPDGAPKNVIRRGTDGGDAELQLANLTCMILADSPRAEEKIRPLEQAFEELERAIRP